MFFNMRRVLGFYIYFRTDILSSEISLSIFASLSIACLSLSIDAA